MRVTVDQKGNIVLSEVYSGVILRTEEGNEMSVCMRDDTFEICLPKMGGQLNDSPVVGENRWFRVNPKAGTIEKMG